MSRVLLLVLVTLAASACGGAIEQPAPGDAPAPMSTLSSASQDAPLEGTWDLVRLDYSGRPPTEVHDVLQMDIRKDGSVAVRRCGKTYAESVSATLRCGDAASYDCYYGSLHRDGETVRIDLPDLMQGKTREQGLVDRSREGIDVRYVLPNSISGHFIRVDDAEKYGTTSSSTVANCKGP